MTQLHLIIGPVGAGKSTYARTLTAKHGAVMLVLDDWMARLYGADARPPTGRIEWYVERRDRCLAQIWDVTERIVEAGASVVLEVGLIQRAEREAFYAQVDAAGYELAVYVVDAPRDVRRERVRKRNEEKGATFHTVVSLEFFELASDMWQEPDAEEARAHRVSWL